MGTKTGEQAPRSAFEIVEEAFHLFRNAGPGPLAAYYVGSLPFVVGLLYFWADMSTSAYAFERTETGALGLVFLFIWMKMWQTYYARLLWARVTGEIHPRWGLGRFLRVAFRQATIQASGFLALPVAIILALPYGFVNAFLQSATVLDDGAESGLTPLMRKAAAQAKPWQRQNLFLNWMLSPHLLVAVIAIFLVIMPIMEALTPAWTALALGIYSTVYLMALMPLSPFGVAVALNIGLALIMIPPLLNTFLGVQTVFTAGVSAMMNSTFFAVVCGLTYLGMDPLLKAAYVLRCFYVDSIHSGADLRVELRRFATKAPKALVLCAAAGLLVLSATAEAQDPAAAPAPEASTPATPAVDSAALQERAATLDAALTRELEHPRYAWRLPRIAEPEEEATFLVRQLRRFSEAIMRWGRKAIEWLDKAADWIAKHFPKAGRSGGSRSLTSLGGSLKITLWVLLGALAIALAVLFWRTWRAAKNDFAEMAIVPVEETPDLEDEGTRPDALPVDGWLAMAHELADRGEYRLALRAVFLATLANLANRELIRVASFKTNREYRQELERRGHAEPSALEVFRESSAAYEAVWYGCHESTRELVSHALNQEERLRIRV